MANIVDSGFTKVVYAPETVYNEDPSGVGAKELRVNGENLNFKPKFVDSKELRSDRQIPDLVQVGAEVTGDVPAELSYSSYDDLFETAFFNTWTAIIDLSGTDMEAIDDDGAEDSAISTSTTVLSSIVKGQWIKISGFATEANNGAFQVKSVAANKITFFGIKLTNEVAGEAVALKNGGTLKNGVEKKSIIIEKQFTDENLYQYFKGCRVAGFSLDFASSKIIDLKFNFMGAVGSEITSSSVMGTVAAPDTNEKMNAVAHFTQLSKDDVAISSKFMTLGVELDNGLRGQEAIGTLGFIGIGAGRSTIKGKIDIYLDSVSSAAFYNAGIANTPFKLSFQLQDNAGNTYIMTLWKAKLNDLNNNASAIDQDVMIKSGFQAIMDDSGISGITIQLDRFPA